jgi:hypothetical protein
MDRFACAHCGNEHIVRRQGGVVALEAVAAGLKQIQSGTDRTASELAIARLTAEIDEIRTFLRDVRASILTATSEPHAQEEFRDMLKIARSLEGRSSADLRGKGINELVAELSTLSIEQVAHMRSTHHRAVTLGMIWTNLRTVKELEEKLLAKQTELAHHRRIVSA